MDRLSIEWRGRESNPRHHDFQSCALPTELPRQAPKTACGSGNPDPAPGDVIGRAATGRPSSDGSRDALDAELGELAIELRDALGVGVEVVLLDDLAPLRPEHEDR